MSVAVVDRVLDRAAREPERAVAILEAARADPDGLSDPRLLLALSRAYEVDGRLKEGVEVCQDLLGRHPRLAAGWTRLGGLFLAAGLFDKAEQAVARALDLDPADPDIHAVHADILVFSGRLQEARRTLDRLAELIDIVRPAPVARSVVIPVLRNEPGGKHDVAALLDDLAGFEGEVVAVFNDSGAWEALRDHPRLARHALNSENAGVGPAWNIGLNLTRSAIVLVLNSDLRIDDLRCLAELEEALTGTDDTVLAGVGGELIDPASLNPTRTLLPGRFEGRVPVDSVQGHLFAIHAGRAADAGLSFDPRLAPFFCEEIDIGRQARRAGLRLLAIATDGWRHAVGISRTDYPVTHLGTPVDRNLVLLENRIRLREKWRRLSAEPTRMPVSKEAGETVEDGSTAPVAPPASQQSAADRAEDHYYLYSRPEVRALVPATARRVLDIGCGAGALGAELKRERGCEVWGVEFQPDIAERARDRLDRVLAGDVFQLRDRLPEAGFDAVIMADVLEHVIDSDGLLAIVRRVLAPGGRLVLSLPNIGHWSVIAGLLQGRFDYAEEGLLDRTHLRFFTPSSANRMLARNGFVAEIATGKTLPDIGPPEGLVSALKGVGVDAPSLPSTASVYQMLFVCRVG